ncbi:XRE family transcriptional regulator [Ktedonosporobacter rubrisoli]|uniref:XRE family transcriptional regulator n=1 Tax=Ktedonosporobacter rubrisoli TaxID=2509675 RepID=A0A4P6JKC4_KTERU|nr:helix-turn-helix transcriptional regulator [Ktedonosporobacter rubrisoli]QBD75420.1 XRE family transcriptional regulator [Ktedonosporobacter rubrisoli]
MPRLRLRVKEVSQEKGVSIMMLSRKSYLALNTIRSIYHNPYRRVGTDTLQKLAKALEVSIFDLMEEVPDEEPGEKK